MYQNGCHLPQIDHMRYRNYKNCVYLKIRLEKVSKFNVGLSLYQLKLLTIKVSHQSVILTQAMQYTRTSFIRSIDMNSMYNLIGLILQYLPHVHNRLAWQRGLRRQLWYGVKSPRQTT